MKLQLASKLAKKIIGFTEFLFTNLCRILCSPTVRTQGLWLPAVVVLVENYLHIPWDKLTTRECVLITSKTNNKSSC